MKNTPEKPEMITGGGRNPAVFFVFLGDTSIDSFEENLLFRKHIMLREYRLRYEGRLCRFDC